MPTASSKFARAQSSCENSPLRRKHLASAASTAHARGLRSRSAQGRLTDSRADGFVARHGRLVQVELDAPPPEVLRALYQDAIDRYLDVSTYDAVVEREDRERGQLSAQEVG